MSDLVIIPIILYFLYLLGRMGILFLQAVRNGEILSGYSSRERRRFLLLLACGSFILAMMLCQGTISSSSESFGVFALVALLLACLVLPLFGVAAGCVGLMMSPIDWDDHSVNRNTGPNVPHFRAENDSANQSQRQTGSRSKTSASPITLLVVDADIKQDVAEFSVARHTVAAGVEQDISDQPAHGESSSDSISADDVATLIRLAQKSTNFPQRIHIKLRHRLDAEAEQRWSRMNQAFDKLYESSYVWNIKDDARLYGDRLGDRRVHREKQLPQRAELSFMTVDVAHNAFRQGEKLLLFLPDHVYLYDPLQGITLYKYSSVTIKTHSVEFTEDRYYAREAPTLWTTWLHTRKDGEPDRRYKDNPMISGVVYSLVEIRLGNDILWELLVSSIQKADEFRRFFYESQQSPGSWSDSRYKTRPKSANEQHDSIWPYTDPQAQAYFVILDLDMNATEDEVKSAYRRLAKTNHPDLVSGLDPHFRKLAESRMKEINEAYAYISKHLMDQEGRRSE